MREDKFETMEDKIIVTHFKINLQRMEQLAKEDPTFNVFWQGIKEEENILQEEEELQLQFSKTFNKKIEEDFSEEDFLD